MQSMVSSQSVFRWSMTFLVFHMFLVLMTPVFTVNSFLYPIRVDSTMIAQQLIAGGDSVPGPLPLHPSQILRDYEKIYFKREGQPGLIGWISYDTTKTIAPLMVIVPDYSEGKINYLMDMAEWNSRGFHVCVMDMRGQGESEGVYYDPGMNSIRDLLSLCKKLKAMDRMDYIVCMGIGTGAGICLGASTDPTFEGAALILQNPSVSLEQIFQRKALVGWGGLLYPFLPVLKRSYERSTGIDFHEHNYTKIIGNCHLPYLVVGAGYITNQDTKDIVRLLEADGNPRKKIFWEIQSNKSAPFHQFSKKYYDHLSGFVVSSRQSPVFKVRRKKLVLE